MSEKSTTSSANALIFVFVLYAVGLFILTLVLLINTPTAKDGNYRSDIWQDFPEFIPNNTIPDFQSITDVALKKSAFFNYLLPAINSQNQRIEANRSHLFKIKEKLDNNQALNKSEREKLLQLQTRYQTEDLQTLIRRVDKIPASLALAQAANESGWGTSRFAQEGNNFYGQWCYEKGCGIVPNARLDGANHEVKTFPNVTKSIEAYFNNINTHEAYYDLRIIREQLRNENKRITGKELAKGLEQYSEKGYEYVVLIQNMIDSNRLEKYDNPQPKKDS
ncbi:glucosaminidase domain-containing protein [Sessilibacter sp. MAH1]